jgi:hypothetical protein
MHITTVGSVAAYGLIAFFAGIMLWRYKKGHRFQAIFLGLAAALFAISVVPWTDALASLTSSGTGLAVLVIVMIVSGFGFWFEAIRKHMHHRIRTPVLAITFGTALVLTIGNAARLVKEAATSPGKTTAALAHAESQIRSGHAAALMPHQQALTYLAIAAGVVILLIVLAARMEKGKGASRGGMPALPPGRSASSSRPALPALTGRKR